MKIVFVLVICLFAFSKAWHESHTFWENDFKDNLDDTSFLVDLKVHFPTPSEQMCNGVVIATNFILTTAGCFKIDEFDENSIGVTVLFGKKPEQRSVFMSNRFIIIHEDYGSQPVVNDIALIRLPFELEFDELIQAAKLPTAKSLRTQSDYLALGYNFTNTEKLIIPYEELSIEACHRTRKFVTPAILCYDLGDQMLPQEQLLEYKKIHCKKIPGGALMLNDGSRTLVGIISYERYRCTKSSVFTKVSYYMDWIEENFNKYGGHTYNTFY